MTERPGAPDASLRHIRLAGQEIPYRLLRVRRRSIGMLINHQGLAVRAPRWVALREIEAALAARAGWIVKTLEVWRNRGFESLPADWRTGSSIMYLGASLTLKLFPSRKASIDADLLDLTVLHPKADDEAAIAAFVRGWLRQQALALLTPRVLHFAGRVVERPPKMALSNARTQWGSCNHKGHIRLNWRLVQLPPRLSDYVVAHEVAHLIELNHSPRFWKIVDSLLPGHAEAKRELDAMTPMLD